MAHTSCLQRPRRISRPETSNRGSRSWATNPVFPIGDSLIAFQPSDSYGRAFLVGVINTFYVAVLSIALATVVGVIIGVAEVSRNWLIAKLAEIYVEILRNIPLLLTLLFVYGVVLAGLPSVRKSIELFGCGFLNQRGLYLARPIPMDGFDWVLTAFGLALLGAVVLILWARRLRDRTGVALPSVRIGLALVVGLPLAAYFVVGAPLNWDMPVLKGFNYRGRMGVPAGIRRPAGWTGSSIAAPSSPRTCAAASRPSARVSARRPPRSACRRGRTMQLVVLPQALRTIIPSTTNDYASLVKDSSLAVAIGYPDMVSIGGTMIGQNGQAIEVIGMWMAIYLAINLVVSLLMNWAQPEGPIGGALTLTEVFVPHPTCRPRPSTSGAIGWLRENLFKGWFNSALTLLALAFLGLVLPPLVSWLVLDATFLGDADACRASGGACWSFIGAEFKLFMVGTYPGAQTWRAGPLRRPS